MRKTLLLINGVPASGKSTLFSSLKDQLGASFISKDDIKLWLMQYVQTNDRKSAIKLGPTILSTSCSLVELSLENSNLVIFENNFDKKLWRDLVIQISEKHDAQVIEIYCSAPEKIIKERFLQRSNKQERHPGFGDIPGQNIEDKYLADLADGPLSIGQVVDIDTSALSTESCIEKVLTLVKELESK